MPKRDYSSWSKEDLIRELDKSENRKRYGIVWEDKPEDVALFCKEKLPVLSEDKEREIIINKNGLSNILIEGDNYHALSVLNYTHKGKIDIIYIDPPYNTGNGDTFRYNDKIIDKEDSYRHSKWLSFMSKRLVLAKNLLKSSGAIFISIDDNEVAQLKLLCDKIFNENNFLAIIAWQSTDTLRNDAKYFSPNCEFILVYAKNKDKFKIKGIRKGEKQKAYYKNYDGDPRGPYLLTPLHAKSGTENSLYEITLSNGQLWKPPAGTYPRFSKETLQELDKTGKLFLDPERKKVPQKKTYLSEVSERMPLWTFWKYEDFGSTRQSNAELRELMGRGIFDNPKPTKLMKIIIDSIINESGIVLDFFAGSGTTGQAVLELNEEDGGNRNFILCTNNENDICTEVCYPRVKKVIDNLIKTGKHKDKMGNLRYFKTEFVDAEPTDRNKIRLTKKATEMLCIREETYNKISDNHKFKIYGNGSHYTGIIFDNRAIDEFKEAIKKIGGHFNVYIFSLGGDTFDEEFEEMLDKVKLTPIPESILNTYRKIFR